MTHTMCQVTPHLTSKHTQGGTAEKKILNQILEIFGICVLGLYDSEAAQWLPDSISATQSQEGDMFS